MSTVALTTKELSSITKISQSRLRSWVRRGYIRPSVAGINSPGGKRLWSEEDAALCLAVRSFLPILQPDLVLQAAQTIHQALVAPADRARIIIDMGMELVVDVERFRTWAANLPGWRQR